MSYGQDEHSGVPTRAIHEAYLDMQRSLKAYKDAKDSLQDARINRAHREVQSSTTTLFEFLRPYIKQGDTSADYWNGEVPPYPSDKLEPDIADGVAILQVQRRNEPFTVNNNLNLENGVDNKKLHDQLGLNDDTRICGVSQQGDVVFVAYQAYMMGLKHIDKWETTRRTQTVQKGGFMSDKTQQKVQARRVDMPKLKRAARSLNNVCHDLGLLAQVQESRDSYHAASDDVEHAEPYGTAKKPE